MRRLLAFIAIGAVWVALSGQAHEPAAATAVFDQKAALQVSQDAIGRPLGDYTLLDRKGHPLRLASYRGKPLLVSLIYTKCSESCPVTTRYLGNAVKIMSEALGADSFSVLSVGFDTDSDTPQAMQQFAAQAGIDFPNWEFASGDPATLKELTRDLGFRYRPTMMGFEHISELSIIDPDGKVYRKVYGDEFDLPQLGEPLKNLIGRENIRYPVWHSLGARIRLFCTVYDPSTGRYRTDYSFFVGMLISAAMVLPFGYWLYREIRRAWGSAGQST
jgi:protein SCO1